MPFQFRPAGRRAALFALVVALAPVPAFAEEVVVKIDNFAFTPAAVTVKAGTTVTFENDDDIPHLVVADDKSFRSKALDTGDRFSVTLGKAGSVPYFCALHPHMMGSITVTP